jgi:hypothetical protein
MRHQGSPLVFVFTLLLLSGMRAAAAGVSLDEYRRQLHELAAGIDVLKDDDNPEKVRAILVGIPDQVTVNTKPGEITINQRDLKNDLATLSRQDAQKRAGLLRQIHNYCRELENEATAYDQGGDLETSRRKLNSILASREFRNVHGPTARDALMARLLGWLDRVVNRLFRGARGAGGGWLRVLVYLLVGAAMILLVVWTALRLNRPQADSPREIVPFAPSARSWRSWLAEARALAAHRDWRNAIHIAYWAGISFLEEKGAWKPNRARTPREYLRMVSSRKPQYPPLAALTRKFEVIWYGHRDAGESDFQETLGQLERLGCH